MGNLRPAVDERSPHPEAAAPGAEESGFLASARHDLRQPLQALGLFLAVLSRRPVGEEERTLLVKMQQSFDLFEGLLDDVLRVAMLESGDIRAAPADFPLASLFARLAEEFEPIAARKGVALRMSAPRGLLHADSELLFLILRNFLAYAIDHGGGRLLLGARRRAGGARVQLCLKGSPNGQGEHRQAALPLAIAERAAALTGLGLIVSAPPGRGISLTLEGIEAAACWRKDGGTIRPPEREKW